METLAFYCRWEQWPEKADAALESILPPERRKRMTAMPQHKRREVLAAYGLLRRGVQRLLGMEQIPVLSYGASGKPCFLDISAVQFNLSHTEQCALCVFSHRPVGADVEKIRPVSRERALRLQLPEDPDAFFAEWAARESRIKLRGESALHCRAPVAAKPGEHLTMLPLHPAFAAAVCAYTTDPIQVEEMEPAALL